jgi:hypothetical protein
VNFDDSGWVLIPYTALEQRRDHTWGARARMKRRRPPTHLPTIRRPRTETRRMWWARHPR